MQKLINIVIGYDEREAVAYHTFCQSLIENSSVLLSLTPLAINHIADYAEKHKDQSNAFIYTRFLTPYIKDFNGWAIFMDGDMICLSDINNLWKLRDESKAVMVVQYNYKTKAKVKYLGNINEDYPRKNWSSVILWNCSHEKNKILTPDFVEKQRGQYLPRFSWLTNSEIGVLPLERNWLAIEYPENKNAHMIHYTLGTPCFKNFKDSSMSSYWHKYFHNLKTGFEK